MKRKLSGEHSFKSVVLYCDECGNIFKADIPLYARYMNCPECKGKIISSVPNGKFPNQKVYHNKLMERIREEVNIVYGDEYGKRKMVKKFYGRFTAKDYARLISDSAT